MSLVTTTTTQETIMLLRVFSHVKSGIYIEVAGSDGSFLSTSQVFYGQVWQGISLAGDPLACGAGTPRTLRIPDGETLTLADACAARCGEAQIHLLRMAAAGDALAGVEFSRCRPWLVVAEGLQPSPPAWEPLLATHGYRFLGRSGASRVSSPRSMRSWQRPSGRNAAPNPRWRPGAPVRRKPLGSLPCSGSRTQQQRNR